MEFINVPYIFHDPSVKTCIPSDVKFDDATVVYSFINPIRSKIFNFNEFILNLGV